MHDMKKIFFIFIFLVVTVFSCSRNKGSKDGTPPENIVSAKEMTKIMVDVLLAESTVGVTEVKYKNQEYYTRRYYNFILKKHNITIEQFRKSYSYYASDVEKMLKIMTDVVDTLSEKQSKIRNK